MFDEPSSYLDVKQRLKVAQAIRNLSLNDQNYDGSPKPCLITFILNDLVSGICSTSRPAISTLNNV